MAGTELATDALEVAFDKSLGEERVRVARWLNTIRMVAQAAWLLLAIVRGSNAAEGGISGLLELPFRVAALVIAVMIFGMGRWSQRFLRRSPLALALVDVPFLFVTLRVGIQYSTAATQDASALLGLGSLLFDSVSRGQAEPMLVQLGPAGQVRKKG